MKTVVITGSARGFGFEMAKLFRSQNCNIVLLDRNEKMLRIAEKQIHTIASNAKVFAYVVDITNQNEMKHMVQDLLKKVHQIDIWINNAGINQPNRPIWELTEEEINQLIDVDLKGTILCSNLILPIFIKQKYGQLYNVEGHGSNDAKILGLSLYGTSKRAVTYFTEALAYEVEEKQLPIQIGKLRPGIMITNFITTALGEKETIELDEKTKKVYNILGDDPKTIATFMVEKILRNKKNNVTFTWLTNRKAAFRFMTSGFTKRDFFKEK